MRLSERLMAMLIARKINPASSPKSRRKNAQFEGSEHEIN